MSVTFSGADEMIDMDPDILLLEPREKFDTALVGYVERCGQEAVACYDYEQVIESLKSDGEMTEEEAQEWFSFNILGSWVGVRTPCFLFRSEAV
tara:strand:+ start:686 stop:967 length:282 start_codon:yes stop_codon:yes gene_type:complete